TLFLVLFATTSALIFTLPYPNSVYVFAIMMYSFVAGLVLLLAANALILRGRNSTGWLKALPLFHVTMLIYVASMIADYFV
ncbi:MAG TPA: hypothetical protein VMW03_00800, partial [Candidatus Krumholzibacteriaceae bacterium]|nr:hypothetical protein [Candidatus Krumholzibacteriaceae bacterium]